MRARPQPHPGPGAGVTKAMRLGVAYNVFDGEELLEDSVLSVRALACHVVVVYQLTSNWGERARPGLEVLLRSLHARGLVDELRCVEPTPIPPGPDRAAMVSSNAPTTDVGTDRTYASLNDAFFMELRKREVGRQMCKAAGCTHFMSMDTDEFYQRGELESLMALMERALAGTGRPPLASVAPMRLLFKDPRWELLPQEDSFMVPVVCVCDDAHPLRLMSDWKMVVDPTRRVDCHRNDVLVVPRSTCEMWHMSFVRHDVACKLRNTSNRENYGAVANDASDPNSAFARDFAAWEPHMPPIHPHPVWRKFYTTARVLPNHFGVDLEACCAYCLRPRAPLRCAQCKTARYCTPACQGMHWDSGENDAHRNNCKGDGGPV